MKKLRKGSPAQWWAIELGNCSAFQGWATVPHFRRGGNKFPSRGIRIGFLESSLRILLLLQNRGSKAGVPSLIGETRRSYKAAGSESREIRTTDRASAGRRVPPPLRRIKEMLGGTPGSLAGEPPFVESRRVRRRSRKIPAIRLSARERD